MNARQWFVAALALILGILTGVSINRPTAAQAPEPGGKGRYQFIVTPDGKANPPHWTVIDSWTGLIWSRAQTGGPWTRENPLAAK